MGITVKPLQNTKDGKDFFKLPWQIYQGNPNWVPPLLSEVKETLDTTKNPFWEHARRELF